MVPSWGSPSYVPFPFPLPLTNLLRSKDSSLSDLARKFNITLEAIALQTRHILDEMNGKGHAITAIYMSGSQAKNSALMQLLANTCGVPIVLPANPSAAVVLGAAMLGRFAAEADGRGKMSAKEQGEALWEVMVGSASLSILQSRLTSGAGGDDTDRHGRAAEGVIEGEEDARAQVQDLPRVDRHTDEVAEGDG